MAPFRRLLNPCPIIRPKRSLSQVTTPNKTAVDKRYEQGYNAICMPRWRNWQTRQVEGLVNRNVRKGSSPFLGTTGD